MKTKLSKKFIISVVTLVLLVCLVMGEVVAWFLISNKVDSGNIEVGVIGNLDEHGSMSVTVNGKPSDKNDKSKLLPGKTIKLGILIENTTLDIVQYRILLKSATITYPTKTSGYAYPENIILSENYFTIVNSVETMYNINDVLDKNAFFRKFIEPMTNAIKYKAYNTVETTAYTELIETKKKTTEAELSSGIDTVVAENIFLPFKAENFTDGNIDASGNITIKAGKKVNLTLDLYFNGEYYPRYNDGAVEYILKNSNVFIKQNIFFIFSFEAKVV